MSNNFHPQRKKKFPIHIGIIPDGGRRWAKKNHISHIKSYRISIVRLFELTMKLYLNGAEAISVYFSSVQNFKRSNNDIYSFCKAEAEFIEGYEPHYRSNNVKIIVAGDRAILPNYLNEAISKAEEATRKNKQKTLYLCVAYDPFREIEYAIKRSNGAPIQEYLIVDKPLDIIIRSGGANLLSNFLPLQSGFARIYTSDKLFNDMEYCDFENYIKHYMKIDQIYGE